MEEKEPTPGGYRMNIPKMVSENIINTLNRMKAENPGFFNGRTEIINGEEVIVFDNGVKQEKDLEFTFQ